MPEQIGAHRCRWRQATSCGLCKDDMWVRTSSRMKMGAKSSGCDQNNAGYLAQGEGLGVQAVLHNGDGRPAGGLDRLLQPRPGDRDPTKQYGMAGKLLWCQTNT